MPELEFRLLGPVAISADGTAVPLAGGKPRALLAALLLRANRPVSRDLLIEALWPGTPPASAAHALEVHVSRTRKALEAVGAGERLRTAAGAYLLEVRPGELDLERFEQLTGGGRDALAGGDPASAVRSLTEALALWRDDPLPELAEEPLARIETERLRELRLEATESRLEALLALGEHAAALAELQAFVDANPLRERPRAQLMLALYRSGRQADALDAYQQARRTLVDELGLDPSEELRNLEQAILRQDSALATPTLIPARRQQTNLPKPPTPIIGREHDIAAVVTLLAASRLVTLLGPGGVGKTRLAIAAAAAFDGDSTAWWIPLQGTRDPTLLVPTIAQTIGAGGGDDLLAALADTEILLVLDNLEQIVEAAPAVGELIERCPRLRVLATSREPLRLAGETRYPVEPLGADAAEALFVARARAVDPGFEPSASVVEICDRLDRLPLALELAAARTAILPADELLERLETRLELLDDGPRDAPQRHRALRTTVEWSADLLDELEREVFSKLAVFRGGFDIAAAENVCETRLPTLHALVDKSLVQRRGSRLNMLETIRELAAERLHASGDEERLRRRHADYFVRVAESANLYFEAVGEQRHDLVLADQDNVRAALDWASGHHLELALELAVLLENFWVTSSPEEGATRLKALLERDLTGVSERLRMRASRVLGAAATRAGMLEQGRQAYADSLAVARAIGDESAVVTVLHRLAFAALSRGDAEEAQVLAAESFELPPPGTGKSEAMSLSLLSELAHLRGDRERARELHERSLQRAHELGFRWWEMNTCARLAELALEEEQSAEAERWAARGLSVALRIGARQAAAAILSVAAIAAVSRGDFERAGQLWGAIEAEEQRRPHSQWMRSSGRASAAAKLTDVPGTAFEEGRLLGLALTLQDAARLVAPGQALDPDDPQRA